MGKEGTKNNIAEKWQMKRKSIGMLAKIAGHFCNVFQMNKMKEISNFQEYQTVVWDQRTLKKTDPETFSFWVNNIFAKR